MSYVLVVVETVPAEQPCEVGKSGRIGTQEGTITMTSTTYSHHPQAEPTITLFKATYLEEGPFVATGRCRNIPGAP